MIRLVTPVAAVLFLAGCAAVQDTPLDDALAKTARTCLAQNKQFIDVWGCVQSRDLLVQAGTDSPRRKEFMKLGDDLASEVEAHELSSDAAKRRLMDGLSAEGSL